MPSLTILVDGTIPVAEDFNGNFRRLNQAVGVNTAIANYAPGDVLYASSTDTLARLPIGNPGDVFSVVGGVPAWTSSGATAAGTWQQRNLQGTLTASTLTVTADSLVLRGSGGATKLHEAVGATVIDPGAAGLNGRDQTAAFTASQDLYAYWISNGVFARGVWADSAPPTGPDLTTLPAFAGYTYWAYIGAFRWTAGSAFLPALIRGATIAYQPLQRLLTDGTATTETTITTTAVIPRAATMVQYLVRDVNTGGGLPLLTLRVLTGVDAHLVIGGTVAAQLLGGSVWLPTPNLFYLHNAAVGGGATIDVQAYTVANGGD